MHPHASIVKDVITEIVDEINFFIKIPPIEAINSHPLSLYLYTFIIYKMTTKVNGFISVFIEILHLTYSDYKPFQKRISLYIGTNAENNKKKSFPVL